VLTLIIAVVRLPSSIGFGWLACFIGLIFAGGCGLRKINLDSILLLRTCSTLAVAAFMIFLTIRGYERAGPLFAIFALRLALSAWIALRTLHSIKAVPSAIQERVHKMFVTAFRSDPATTTGLIRVTGLVAE
jgi:hypothetical protein